MDTEQRGKINLKYQNHDPFIGEDLLRKGVKCRAEFQYLLWRKYCSSQ
jgi:hypothetical protein